MPQFNLPDPSNLRSLGRRFLFLPVYKFFQSIKSTVSAVKEPTSQLNFQAMPVASIGKRPCQPITIISANLWHDWPRHRNLLQRLNAFADMVETEAADIILLQEVARTTKIKVDEWLAARLGMESVYARANGHEKGIGFEEGLAILSRFPIETMQSRQLGESAFQMVRRMGLRAEVSTPCGNMMVYSVHLGISKKDNHNQLKRLQEWIHTTAKGKTAFIGGDFNTHETKPQIRHIQSRWLDVFRFIHPDGDGTTHEFHLPWGKTFLRHRLDYLFMHSDEIRWKILDARHICAQVGRGIHSDHRAVQACFVPINE